MVVRTKTKADLTSEVTSSLQLIIKSAKRSMRAGLEQQGYVRRERDDHDRRVVWIDLTPEGEQIQSTLGGFFSQFGQTFSVLGAKDLERLAELLGRVAAAIEKEGR